MNRTQLRASRISWRRKLSWAERRERAAINAHDGELIKKWHDRAAHCRDMIARRTEQIDELTPLRLKAFAVAEHLVGVVEQGGNNVGPIVSKIIRANGGTPGEPWCGDFVAYAYRTAGSKLVSRSWASVYFLGRLVGVRKIGADEVRRGDIARYAFSHTGLFDSWVDKEAGVFLAVEGNTGEAGAVSDSTTGGDGVYRKRRNVAQVTDFRRVTR